MIMNFKKFMSIFKTNESIKDDRLNHILDKISKGSELSKNDRDFLDNYEKTTEHDLQDHKMLSKESTFALITKLLDSGKNVICNITDKNGKIGYPIKSIYNNINDEQCVITLSNNEITYLYDRFLYNVLCDDDGNYSLETGEEFFEKIPLRNDN